MANPPVDLRSCRVFSSRDFLIKKLNYEKTKNVIDRRYIFNVFFK